MSVDVEVDIDKKASSSTFPRKTKNKERDLGALGR